MSLEGPWHLRPELEFTDSIDSWNVRASPSFDADVVCVLTAGVSFGVISQQDDWLHVRLDDGICGWSYRKFGDKDALAPVHAADVLELTPSRPPPLRRQLSRKDHVDGLLVELGERRRALDAVQGQQIGDQGQEMVQAAAAVQTTMAQLEVLGIEQDSLFAAEGTEALSQVAVDQLVEAVSEELGRNTSFDHAEFLNPDRDSCWLSTFFQSLWHSRVFHTLFDHLVRPLPPQGAGSATDALRDTWALYAREATAGRLVSVGSLVKAWGGGYGDCAEAFAKLHGEPALQPLADLFAMVPVPFTGSTLTPEEMWTHVQRMSVCNAPLLALDLSLPPMDSASTLILCRGLLPRSRKQGESDADLGLSHGLVSVICYQAQFSHYVVFCRRQSNTNSWMFFNDLPGLARDARRELPSWEAVAHECARLELQPKVLLYEDPARAQAAIASKEARPALHASVAAANRPSWSLSRSGFGEQLVWGGGFCVLAVVVALILQQLSEIRQMMLR